MQSMMLIIKYGGQLILKDLLNEWVAQGVATDLHDFTSDPLPFQYGMWPWLAGPTAE